MGGLLLGLHGGLRFGGRVCLYHCALRLVLWHKNFAPLRYVRFLNSATARIFLRKVGGGSIFVHPMVLEYCAAMPQASAERQNCNTHGYCTIDLMCRATCTVCSRTCVPWHDT
jgi:hypothetical protein